MGQGLGISDMTLETVELDGAPLPSYGYDATGTIAQCLHYDEFGRITLDTNPGFQPFGFAEGLIHPPNGLGPLRGKRLRSRGRQVNCARPRGILGRRTEPLRLRREQSGVLLGHLP